MPQSPASSHLIACPACDHLHREAPLCAGGKAVCVRCGHVLYRAHAESDGHMLALTLAAAILWALANLFPLMELSMQGAETRSTIFGGVLALHQQGMDVLAVLVFWAAMVAPALMLGAMLYVLVPLYFGRVPHSFTQVMRLIRLIEPWAMIEVLMLGVFVSMVKLTNVGSVSMGSGAWLCLALTLVFAAAEASFDARRLWALRDRLLGTAPRVRPEAPLNRWVVCAHCGLITHTPATRLDCPRCGGGAHARKPHSLSRCLALLVASMVMYLPANLLTIMVTVSPFGVQNDTILSGVIYLWDNDSPDLAVIVFTASIVVPLLKILSLGVLLASVRWRGWLSPLQLGKLYRVVEVVGKWSMLDLFVIALLSSLVDFGERAGVLAGPASIAFGAVVVLTMFAASAFDPRLIWDAQEKNND